MNQEDYEIRQRYIKRRNNFLKARRKALDAIMGLHNYIEKEYTIVTHEEGGLCKCANPEMCRLYAMCCNLNCHYCTMQILLYQVDETVQEMRESWQ